MTSTPNAQRLAKLSVRWSKSERDMLIHYPRKPDGHWLCAWLEHHKGFDSTFRSELEARGYDITTLRISVAMKAKPADAKEEG